MKIAILTNILAPYRIKLFETLAQLADDFQVFLMAEGEENRQWEICHFNFKVIILPGLHFRLPGSAVSSHFNTKIFRNLRNYNPDVIISGGFTLANIIALLYCKFLKKIYISWGELDLKEIKNISFIRRYLRETVVNLSNGFIASSSEAKRAFIRYGAQINSILIEPMPIDVQFFYHKTQSFRNSEQYKIMSAHYSHPLLLSIGRLVPQKGYLELFKIFEQVVSCHPTASLVIIGDGPYRQEFEHHVQIQKLKNVHFVGFVQPYDLPKYFSIADIFVFTTHQDRYGAVILEAMAAKVPVVASIYAAATEDLVIEGITGYRIDPFDILGSTEKICQVINLSAEARTRLVNAAYDKAEPLDAGHSAVRIFNFVNDLHNNYASHTYRSQGLNVL